MDEKKKILWIDDDVNNPELQCDHDALEEMGCIITPVTNPDDLQFDTISQYDCIIIDLFLPVGEEMSLEETQYGSKTGFVLLQRIREKYPQSKTVIYSVFELPDVRSYCVDNGINYWNKSKHKKRNHSVSGDKIDWSAEFAKDIIKVINGEKG